MHVGVVRGVARSARTKLRLASDYLRRSYTPKKLKTYDRVHLGSGSRYLQGWANLDIAGKNNIIWDLRKPLPLAKGKVSFVYSEHFIEHITQADAKTILSHCRAVMASSGVVRISTPDLGSCVEAYRSGALVNFPEHDWAPRSPCEMLNDNMRKWGHQYLYDEAELFALLKQCGFPKVQRVRRSISDHPDLAGLESRPDNNDLIVEASL